jgi:hypothetical protein
MKRAAAMVNAAGTWNLELGDRPRFRIVPWENISRMFIPTKLVALGREPGACLFIAATYGMSHHSVSKSFFD